MRVFRLSALLQFSSRCCSGFCGHRRGRGPLATGQSGDHRIIRGARYVDRRIFIFYILPQYIYIFSLQRSWRRPSGRPTAVILFLLSLGFMLHTGSPVPEGRTSSWPVRLSVPPPQPLTLDLAHCLLYRIICGLTQFTNKSHVAFAALEAVCFQTREVNKRERHAVAAVCGLIVNLLWLQILDAMNQDSGIPLTQLQVDGGMTSNRLLMQLQADILCIPVGEILFLISPPLLK